MNGSILGLHYTFFVFSPKRINVIYCSFKKRSASMAALQPDAAAHIA